LNSIVRRGKRTYPSSPPSPRRIRSCKLIRTSLTTLHVHTPILCHLLCATRLFYRQPGPHFHVGFIELSSGHNLSVLQPSVCSSHVSSPLFSKQCSSRVKTEAYTLKSPVRKCLIPYLETVIRKKGGVGMQIYTYKQDRYHIPGVTAVW
jgi:hypothetical protein